MSSLPNKSTPRRSYTSANDWPSTPEIDGYVWNITDADAAWAAENLNDGWHCEDPVPDDVLDLLADEAAALDRLERGLRGF